MAKANEANVKAPRKVKKRRHLKSPLHHRKSLGPKQQTAR